MYLFQFAQQSNRASWHFTGQLVDQNDAPLNLTGMTMVLGVYDKSGEERMVGSTGNGKITFLGPGIFDWVFTPQDMSSLCRGTYEIGLTLSDGTNTTQIGTGTLPVINGNVP